ncbi:tyrosyl-tRNA synthetase, partial [mine drainage metagenome]
GRNPRDVKLELAYELVARFHGTTAAGQAQQAFLLRVSERAVPADLVPRVLPVEAEGIRLPNLLKAVGLAASTSEANRKIQEGAVRIDGERATDRALMLHAGADVVLQLGSKRFARVKLELAG